MNSLRYENLRIEIKQRKLNRDQTRYSLVQRMIEMQNLRQSPAQIKQLQQTANDYFSGDSQPDNLIRQNTIDISAK